MLINNQATLNAFCSRLQAEPWLMVDTEFMRERSYWPQLCVVQVAGEQEAAVIDALAEGLDLQPLWDLLLRPEILKVFHSGRQDLEIFYLATGRLPLPLFDTQVAAALLGYGEQAGFESLAQKLAQVQLDKGSRFTDWTRRPLSERQVAYALADVTVLRPVYAALRQQLEARGRLNWIEDEQVTLCDPETYRNEPNESWRRLKSRSRDRRLLAVLRAVAAWREREAQRVNIPRGRILRDETVLEVAHHPPKDREALAQMRGLNAGFVDGKMGQALLAVVSDALSMPEEEWPEPDARVEMPPGLGSVVDLLRVLLKFVADEHEIAPAIIATSDDLEALAATREVDADLRTLKGWRRAVFGEKALALKAGKLALSLRGKTLQVIER